MAWGLTKSHWQHTPHTVRRMKRATKMVHGASDQQAKDDPELLQLVMQDLAAAPTEFQPTNYWADYTLKFVEQLKLRGLHNFRRRSDEVFRAFGAVDFVHPMAAAGLSRNRFIARLPSACRARIDNWARQYISVPDELDFETYVRLGYLFAAKYAREGHAKPLSELSVSRVGNPGGIIDIDGRNYTRQSIQYYLQYAYMSRFIDFDRFGIIAELGSGMGRQTEIFAKLHPNSTHLLFDLPPQIYVAEQFLKAVFSDRVVSYRETRAWTSLDRLKPGKIHIFGNYQMPLLATSSIDLFWNSASFHEMEPDIVANYLRFVNASAKWAYLSENLHGGVKAKRPGEPGILKVTTFNHYVSSLPDMELFVSAPALRINGKPLKDTAMIFRRQLTR